MQFLHQPETVGVYSIDDLPGGFKVQWEYRFVVDILLKRGKVEHLTPMAAEVKKQTVVGTSVADEPAHCAKHVGFRRQAPWIGRIIIAKNNRILGSKAISRDELRKTGHVINTSVEFVVRADIVDSNQEGLQSEWNSKATKKVSGYPPSPIALGILILILGPKFGMEIDGMVGDRHGYWVAKRRRGASEMWVRGRRRASVTRICQREIWRWASVVRIRQGQTGR